jgi:hypothetical protein
VKRLILFLLFLVQSGAVNASPLQKVALHVPGRVETVVPADVNGDGAQDVLVFWRQGLPPKAHTRVSVYLAKRRAKGHRIDPAPAQVLKLSERAVAFDVGDAGSDGRADVLFLARDGVWVHSGGKNGRLSTRPAHMIKAMTLASFPHEDHVPRMTLLTDLDDRGRKAVVLPTVPIGPLSLYEYDAARGWFLREVLRVPTRANVHTSAEDFRSSRDYGAVFQLVYPRWELIDQNGDGLRDICFFSQDSVAVFRARKDGSFPERPDLFRVFGLVTPEEKTKRGLLVRGSAGDLNGDGRADLMFNKTIGGISNMKCELRIYLADPSGDYPSRAAFVEKRDGWGASARLQDVNGDGRDDLLRPHVEMGLTTLIGMMLAGKLEVSFRVHLSATTGVKRKPDFQITSALGINFRSAQELHGPYPVLTEDFDGDGIGDLVVGQAGQGSGKNPDSLEIRRGISSGKYADDPSWKLALPATRFVSPLALGDRPGLLIYFSRVERLQGDVWVLHNTGGWKEK